jgi:catechol 2,3-dioxygenase-like lactoylglutathione lyase family enzyme
MDFVHHVDLVVGDLERSVAFYTGLLGPLGHDRVGHITGERGEPVTYVGRQSGGGAIGLRAAPADTTGAGPDASHDRYAIGLHHLAFAAPSRELVDHCARWAAAHGATIEGGPREYDYGPGYYAVFLRDPDNIKLEVVHTPPRDNLSIE